MNDNFKKFLETGKIKYYLKYKEEMASELTTKVKKDEDVKSKGDNFRKS